MNKQQIISQLKKTGITVNSFSVSSFGYRFELKLDPNKANGWEELEQVITDGLEIVKTRQINDYSVQILVIPTKEKEFVDYIKRIKKHYALSDREAMDDLKYIVETLGRAKARNNLSAFLSKKGYDNF